MFGRNIDFFACAVHRARDARVGPGAVAGMDTEALDSIRIENAIRIERCPLSARRFCRI
jgi:hypothetical protein